MSVFEKNDIFPANDPAFEGFDAAMQAMVADFKVPGFATAAIRGSEVVLSKGYGVRNLEKQLPVDSDTIFAIGSSSKAFTTMDLAILVERGLLEWDKPVREYMPDFKLFDPTATEHMTPRDLVCHRSGLPRHDMIWYNSPRSRAEIFASLRYLEPNKDFRSTWQYQNLMFLTAGLLVEKISGMSWEEFTQKEIFDKLGMGRSNFSVEKSQESDNFSYPHAEIKDAAAQIPFRNIDMIGPAGSINSCLTDMTKWVQLHLTGKVGETQLVSEAQLKELHSPAMVMPEAFMGLENFKEISQGNYALGWFVHYYRGRKLIHHGGAIDGFLAMITFMPDENVGTAVLTNYSGAPAFWAATFMMYDRLLGLEPLPWHERWLDLAQKGKEAAKKSEEKASSKKVAGTQPSHPLSAYTGEFVHPGYGPFKVTLEGEQLKASYNNMPFRLEHYHYDIFEAKTEEALDRGGLPVFFHTDYQGAIAKLSAPLEPSVKEILFERVADQSMYEKSFLEQFIGEYEVQGHTAKVMLKGDKTLTIAMPNAPEMELEPCQGCEFKLKDMEVVRVEFTKTDGKVSGLDVSQPGGVTSAKKIA